MLKQKKTQKNWRTFKDRVKPEKKEQSRQLRKNPTPSEAELWKYIRKKQLGYKFRRQAIILGYIVDFYCPQKNLVVEVDGYIHLIQKEYDKKRDNILLKHGFKTLRIPAYYMFDDIELALEFIKLELKC